MIKSMTGFGRALYENKEFSASVQIVSLNKNNFDIDFNVNPKDFYFLYPFVREAVKKVVSRGKVNVAVFIELKNQKKNISFDENAAKELFIKMKMWEKRNFKTETIKPSSILNLRDLYNVKNLSVSESKLKECVNKALDKALKALDDFRKKEGKHIEKFFEKRLKKLNSLLMNIKKIIPDSETKYSKKLKKRLDIAKKREPLTKEEADVFYKLMGIFLEKSDISEEVSRLKSHLIQFSDKIRSKDLQPSGKMLNFLSQEMLREANTMGAKTQDLRIKKYVVELKTAIEEIKEQVLNVE